MARPTRVEYPGAVYHVITRGNNRQKIFKDNQDRTAYLDKLHYYCESKEANLLAYCLLPNHSHLLVETPKANLSKLMQAFQTSYTVYFNRRHGRSGHVFEQRYKAFLVDKDNYLLQVSRYIHLNPVGAKLVKRPRDYRWSSYRDYLKERAPRGLYRRAILEQFGSVPRERVIGYRNFVEGDLEKEGDWFRMPIQRQAFVGDEEFMEEAWRKAKKDGGLRGDYRLSAIEERVCEIVGIDKGELRIPVKMEKTQRGRELFMYLARRYSKASLKEISDRLGVRDISTVSHAVKRAEARLKKSRDFRRGAASVLKKLSPSRIQA